MVGLLRVLAYELADRKITVQFGWPMSSWLDRLAVGVMVFNLMRLPRMFPQFDFDMHYFRRPQEHPPRLPYRRSGLGEASPGPASAPFTRRPIFPPTVKSAGNAPQRSSGDFFSEIIVAPGARMIESFRR